jgi:hypothetical protein
MSKWSVHKWKCRNRYRDGCRPVWMASPPEDDPVWNMSLEFATWREAMTFVQEELTNAT